jgi:hypothetical protein
MVVADSIEERMVSLRCRLASGEGGANVTSAAAVLKDSGEGRLIGCGIEAKLFFAATQTLGERRARPR